MAASLGGDSRFQPTVVAVPAEALALSASRDHGVVVISADLESGSGDGIELARVVHQRHPGLGIIILLDHITREVVIDVFRSGAKGIHCRTEPLADFFSCIEQVSRGQVWAGKMESEYLLEGIRNVPSPRTIDSSGKIPLSHQPRTSGCRVSRAGLHQPLHSGKTGSQRAHCKELLVPGVRKDWHFQSS